MEYLERLSRQGLCLNFLVFAVPRIAKGLILCQHNLRYNTLHYSTVSERYNTLHVLYCTNPADDAAPQKPLLSMRGEEPRDKELDPRSRLREYVDSKRRLVAKKLCYARPTRRSWPLKQRVYGRYLPTEGGRRKKHYHLATRGGSEANEARVGCPCEDPRGG